MKAKALLTAGILAMMSMYASAQINAFKINHVFGKDYTRADFIHISKDKNKTFFMTTEPENSFIRLKGNYLAGNENFKAGLGVDYINKAPSLFGIGATAKAKRGNFSAEINGYAWPNEHASLYASYNRGLLSLDNLSVTSGKDIISRPAIEISIPKTPLHIGYENKFRNTELLYTGVMVGAKF